MSNLRRFAGPLILSLLVGCGGDADGPTTIRAAAAKGDTAEPDACWGAWVDVYSICRGPADGVLPTECCIGQSCSPLSNITCPAGLTCEGADPGDPLATGKCIEKQEEKTCYVGGCSGQICSEMAGLISTCEWLPHYACYNLSQCGAFGADGACAWKKTPELLQCLSVQGQ